MVTSWLEMPSKERIAVSPTVKSRTWRVPKTVMARLISEIFPCWPKAGLLAMRSRRAVRATSLLISRPMSVGGRGIVHHARNAQRHFRSSVTSP